MCRDVRHIGDIRRRVVVQGEVGLGWAMSSRCVEDRCGVSCVSLFTRVDGRGGFLGLYGR